MVNKRVPDWLNSSLWSPSPDPSPDGDPSSPSSNSKHHHSTAVNDSQTHPPIPLPPPLVLRPDPPTKPAPPVNDSPRRDGNGQTATSSPSSSWSTSTSILSAEEVSRQAQLLVELSKKVVTMHDVRRLVSMGIPDGSAVRPTLWKLLLGYLPSDRGSWPSELAKKRSQYRHFKDELLMNPAEVTRRLEKLNLSNDEPRCESRGPLSRSEVTHGEHPLSLGKLSIWNQFFQDTEIIEQIDRDVQRTHPDLPFFSADSPFAKSNREALRSTLIVFAKLNPGIRYVQGMNEILAPLFYVFRNDTDDENAVLLFFMTLISFLGVLFKQ